MDEVDRCSGIGPSGRLREPDIGDRDDDFFVGCQRVAGFVGPRGQRWRVGLEMRIAAALAFLALTGCGVDGAPVPKDTGAEASGAATIGVRRAL